MSPSRIAAIALRILKQFRHDPRTIALIVIVPLLVMALVGYLIGDSGKEPLPVAVVNLDAGAQAPAGYVSLGDEIGGERSSGTLERLMASPASRLDVLLGYLLGFIGFAVAQALLILGYAAWVLDVRIAGSVWLVLLVLVILLIGVVNLGISLSFYARNELQVVQFIPLVLIPQVFLGGLIWPVQTLWAPLRWLSQLFPLTHSRA